MSQPQEGAASGAATSPQFQNVDSSSSSSSSPSSASSSPSSLNMRQTILASAVSGIVSRTFTHPLDTIKARIQAPQQATTSGTPKGRNPFSILRHVWQKEGFRALYRGYATVIVGGTPGTVVYLSTYEFCKDFLSRQWRTPGSQETLSTSWEFVLHLTSGMLAETLACVVYVPVDVIKERLQVQQNQAVSTGANSSASSPPPYRNGWDALQTIIRTEGWKHGIYRGYGATLLSFGPYAALYFGFYEQAKKQCKVDDNPLTFPELVTCNAGAAALASWITSPLDMAKLRLQIQRRRKAPHAATTNTFTYTNMWECLVHTAQTEGVVGLFRGSLARVLHFTPATVISMTVYELLIQQEFL